MAAAAVSNGSEKIFLTCFWKGGTTSVSGHLTVHNVKLILSGSCYEIGVCPPKGLSSAVTSCLFAHPTYGSIKTMNGRSFIHVTESSYEQLHLAIQHLCQLRIYACVCEDSFCDDEVIVDSEGKGWNIKSAWPSVSQVPLVLPVDLQEEQRYVLLIESNNELKLSARLVPEQKAKQDFMLNLAMMKQLHEERMAFGSQSSEPDEIYYQEVSFAQQVLELMQKNIAEASSTDSQQDLMQVVMSQLAGMMNES